MDCNVRQRRFPTADRVETTSLVTAVAEKSMRTIRERCRESRATERRGVATVEFALVSMLFFLFLGGIIEFSRLTMLQNSLSAAAQVGCRRAILSTTTSSAPVETAVRDFLATSVPGSANPAILRVSVTPNALAGLDSETEVTVGLELDFADATWLPGDMTGAFSNVVLRASSTMNRE